MCRAEEPYQNAGHRTAGRVDARLYFLATLGRGGDLAVFDEPGGRSTTACRQVRSMLVTICETKGAITSSPLTDPR